MKQSYRVIPAILDDHRLTLHPETAQRLGLSFRQVGFVRFGLRVVDVEWERSAEIEQDEIGLSITCIERLGLPIECPFELRVNGNELEFGPFIGILAAPSLDRLSEIVQNLGSYVHDYPSIHGSVLALALDSFDPDAQEVRGYLYHPETETWEPGTYGYPASLFKRLGVSSNLRTHLQAALPGRVFNDYLFDKWEMHRWLSQFSSLRPHLPDCRLYQKAQDVTQMLKQHPRVIVKPIRGSQGKGVMLLTREGKGYQVRQVQDQDEQGERLAKLSELEAFLEDKLVPKQFLIQQALDLLEVDQHRIDFRSIVVKNGSGQWANMALIAKIGTQGSIVSNISQGGRAEPAAKTLKHSLHFPDDDVVAKMADMESLSLLAARRLEECGVHAGNLGLDLALDREDRLWILEINNFNPNHTIAIDAGERDLYYQIKHLNMMYAKRLAGFGEA
ncbi:MAG: YheC/YheD family protein [Tumebacillaceae bacterium]